MNVLYCSVCEELQRVLGFDWLLLMMQSHLHPSTVVLSIRILLVMLRSPVAMNKFREGSSAGGWLADTHSILNNRKGVLLGEYTAYSIIGQVCS